MDNKSCGMPKTADNACSTGKDDGGGKGKCCATLVKGALIGGIVMFVYISFSWMVLPWHQATIMSFKDDQAVAVALYENAEKSGIFVLPRMNQVKDETAAAVTKPFAFVSVFKDGIDAKNMAPQLVQQLLLCLFGALVLTCLLKKISCGCPVLLSFKVGLLVAAFDHLPCLIWHRFPLDYTLVGMADDVIAITLAGLVISKVAFKTGVCTPAA